VARRNDAAGWESREKPNGGIINPLNSGFQIPSN
jgi:hypothetical protein